MVELMARYGTAVESWGPLAEGLNGIFSHPFSRTMLNAEGQHHGTGGVPLHVLLLGILDDADASEALAGAAIGYMVTKKWLAISPENPLG